MSNMTVTGITVSLKVGDMNYGQGSERFVSLRSETPEGASGVELSDYNQILETVMTLCGEAHRSIHASRFAEGVINASEYKAILTSQQSRTAKVLNFLRGENATDSDTV